MVSRSMGVISCSSTNSSARSGESTKKDHTRHVTGVVQSNLEHLDTVTLSQVNASSRQLSPPMGLGYLIPPSDEFISLWLQKWN